MKRAFILCLFFLAIITLPAKERVIENPQFYVSSHGNVVVEKVVLNSNATLLYMVIGHSPSFWIRIDSKTYIRVGDEKYIVESAEGIELDKEVFSDETNETHFVLKFPAIDPQAKTLDFIESDCESCFKIWGINLDPDATFIASDIPQHIKDLALAEVREDGTSLETPTLKEGIALLKGRFSGYVPSMNIKIEVYVNNPVTGIQEELRTRVGEDGSFELQVPLVTTMEVLLRFWGYNKFVLLSPDQESIVYVDLHRKSYQETGSEALRIPASRYMFWGGTNADVNNQKEDVDLGRVLNDVFYSDETFTEILGMDAAQYKAYVMKMKDDMLKLAADMKLGKRAGELAALTVKNKIMHYLFFADSYLSEAYRRANKLDYEDELTDYKRPVYDAGYYSFLKELDINDPANLYSGEYENNINSAKYMQFDGATSSNQMLGAELFLGLIQSGRLTPEETESAEYLVRMIANQSQGVVEQVEDTLTQEERNTRLNSFVQKYNNEIQAYIEAHTVSERKERLAQVLGVSKGVAFDLMAAQSVCNNKFEQIMPLTEKDLEALGQIEDPFYLKYATEKNNKLIAELERAKGNKKYVIHDVPESEGEQFFADIVKPFEGSVILVDFWATWCAPCRSAMKHFEPAKTALKEKGVVFIYLTDESSPQQAWENMIPGISGEHFRMTSAQFAGLKQKFGVRGVPSYLILNKKGEQVYFSVGFEGADRLSQLLNDELGE
ncbi:MAG: TlpA family protein disulfide reductase [Mediterranea sp.]|nr:TlpA family protein disulfide reductase [Mediterranea sp.]